VVRLFVLVHISVGTAGPRRCSGIYVPHHASSRTKPLLPRLNDRPLRCATRHRAQHPSRAPSAVAYPGLYQRLTPLRPLRAPNPTGLAGKYGRMHKCPAPKKGQASG
jgi:hypothetical protein